MAAPSVAPTYEQYGVRPFCSGCGRRLAVGYGESLWFGTFPIVGVWGFSCCAINNRK